MCQELEILQVSKLDQTVSSASQSTQSRGIHIYIFYIKLDKQSNLRRANVEGFKCKLLRQVAVSLNIDLLISIIACDLG